MTCKYAHCKLTRPLTAYETGGWHVPCLNAKLAEGSFTNMKWTETKYNEANKARADRQRRARGAPVGRGRKHARSGGTREGEG